MYFYENNKYEIKLYYFFSDDIVDVYNVSRGDYIVKDSLLTMFDDFWKFTMTFRMSGCSLTPIKSYKFIKDNSISCYENNCFEYQRWDYKFLERYQQFIDDFRNKYNGEYVLNYGKYKSNGPADYLILSADGCYEMLLGDCIISRGSWKRENTKLLLYDVDIMFQFELYIGDNVLMSKSTPFCHGGATFQFESSK